MMAAPEKAKRHVKKTAKAKEQPTAHESDEETQTTKKKRKKGPSKKKEKLPRARESDSDASVVEVEEPGGPGVEVECVKQLPKHSDYQLMSRQLEGRGTYMVIAFGAD
jgi:hypothetical protein